MLGAGTPAQFQLPGRAFRVEVGATVRKAPVRLTPQVRRPHRGAKREFRGPFLRQPYQVLKLANQRTICLSP